MKKPRKESENVTNVTLDVHQWARLSERAAELSLQIGRVVSLNEYLLLLVRAYMAYPGSVEIQGVKRRERPSR